MTDGHIIDLYLRWMELDLDRADPDRSGTGVDMDSVCRHWRNTIDEIVAEPATTRTAVYIQALVVLSLIALDDEYSPVLDAARSVLVNLISLRGWP